MRNCKICSAETENIVFVSFQPMGICKSCCIAIARQTQALPREEVKPKYEYEVFVEDCTSTNFFGLELSTWLPIEYCMIKKPENIDKYIKNGILRKIENNGSN